jgi:mannose-6-phosphate isomerase-like protein (cupin superfamily)
VQGAMHVVYNDGSEEVLKQGDVFYMPPGHTAIVEENVKMIDFNATKEFREVIEHIGKKMAEAD